MTYNKFGVSDNAVGQLDAGIGASTTTITLGVGQGALFPPAGSGVTFVPTLVQYVIPADPTSGIAKREKILVINRSGDILTVTRGYDGDTPTSFLAGDYLYLNVTSIVIEDIQDEVSRLETAKLNLGALRTGLANAWKMFFSNGSNAETEVALGAAGTVLTSNGATNAPTFEVPTVSITGLTEDTSGDITADFFVKNNGTGGNTKIKLSSYIASLTEVLLGTSSTKLVTPKDIFDIHGFTRGAGSTYLAATSRANVNVQGVTVLTKIKEIACDLTGTYTINYTKNASGTDYTLVQSQIYKNGVAFGTLHNAAGGSIEIYTQDLSFTAGDLIQVYAKSNNPDNAQNFSAFEVKYSLTQNLQTYINSKFTVNL